MNKTRSYDKFRYIQGNRDLTKSHIDKLVRSITEKNLLEANPIIVNEEFEVIDGQHRLAAAKEIGAEIYYIVVREAGLPEVQSLNSNMKNWSLQDYVNSYISLGKTEYQILDSYCKRFNLGISSALELLGGRSHSAEKTHALRAGNLVIKDLKRAEAIAMKLTDYAYYVEASVVRNRDFIRAVSLLHDKKTVHHAELIRKLSLMKDKLHRQGSMKLYLRALEDIYNYKRKQTVRFV